MLAGFEHRYFKMSAEHHNHHTAVLCCRLRVVAATYNTSNTAIQALYFSEQRKYYTVNVSHTLHTANKIGGKITAF